MDAVNRCEHALNAVNARDGWKYSVYAVNRSERCEW